VFEIHDNPLGKRLYVCGWRMHHGFAGIVLAGLGIALAVHDRSDYKIWLKINDR